MLDGNALSLIGLTLTVFLINIIPAFAPPSWLLLGIYKVSNPSQNIFVIALLGVIGSVAGRAVMYAYSSKFRRFLPKKYARNVHYLKSFAEKSALGVFITSFLFSLGPLPSNAVFITSGISGIRPLPVLAGFALGRLLSYSLLVYVSFRTLVFFQLSGINMKLLADLLGIAASVSVIFIDWKKFVRKKK